MRSALAAVLIIWAAPAFAEISVPSGQPVTLFEHFLETQEDGTTWYRLRYIAPQIARETGSVTYAAAEEDFLHLCTNDALVRLTEAGAEAGTIVISLMDRPVEFGASDPQATQFFEAFRRENATCIWEGF